MFWDSISFWVNFVQYQFEVIFFKNSKLGFVINFVCKFRQDYRVIHKVLNTHIIGRHRRGGIIPRCSHRQFLARVVDIDQIVVNIIRRERVIVEKRFTRITLRRQGRGKLDRSEALREVYHFHPLGRVICSIRQDLVSWVTLSRGESRVRQLHKKVLLDWQEAYFTQGMGVSKIKNKQPVIS